MAVNWIKIETSLPKKPEVFGMAKIVRQTRREIVGQLLDVWLWLNEVTATGRDIPVAKSDIDEVAGCAGFAAAMHQVGWLAGEDGALQIPNWERHNGNSAKARALESEAKRLRRLSDNVSDICPTILAPNVRPDERRREETRGEENISSRRDQSIGEEKVPCQSSPSSRSSLNFSSENAKTGSEGEAIATRSVSEDPLDLADVNWSSVLAMAEAAGRDVFPKTAADRRAWIKYAVMAEMSFSEAWIAGAARSAADKARSGGVRQTVQSLFVRALQKSAEEKFGTSIEDFNSIFRRIEIPITVWKSDALKKKGSS